MTIFGNESDVFDTTEFDIEQSQSTIAAIVAKVNLDF